MRWLLLPAAGADSSIVRMVVSSSNCAEEGPRVLKEQSGTTSDPTALDRPMLDAAASTIRASRRSHRLLKALAPLVLVLVTFFTPVAAIAAGDGELQIGNAVYTESGRHELTGDVTVATGSDGSQILADGTLLAGPVPAAPGGPAGAMNIDQCGSIEGNSSFSPVVRWASTGAYQEHHNSLSDNIFKSAGRAIPAAFAMVASIPGDIGQASWGMAAQVTGFSTEFCPIVAMGPRIDLIAGTLGNVILNSGLGALLLAISAGFAVMRLFNGARRGGGGLKAAASSLLVPVLMGALLVMMVAPAMSGATKADESQGTYDPAFMTPGWVLTKTSETLGTVVNVPLKALSSERVTDTGFDLSAGPAGSRGPGSCIATTNAWASSLADSRHSASPATDAISDLWGHAGVPYYINYQFGSSDNAIGWYSYCRVLDANAGVYSNTDDPDTDAIEGTWSEEFRKDYELPVTGGNLNMLDSGALPKMAVKGKNQDQVDDAAIIGWMVCRPDTSGESWSLVEGAENISGEGSFLSSGAAITAEDCPLWWAADSEDEIPKSMMLEPGDEGTVATGNSDLDEALRTLHSTPSVPVSDGFGLMLSGIVALIVFGVVAGVIMLSKIGVVGMGLFMVGAFVIGMVSGTGRNLKKYTLSTLGLLLVTILAQAAFVVIAVVSKILLALGSTFFSSSVFMMAAWAAIAPVLAVILLHFGTKALFGTSPFTLRGAKTLATKGIDPGMLAGVAALGSSGAGFVDRARSARKERQLTSKSDTMRSSAGQAVEGGTKHNAVGAMGPAEAPAAVGAGGSRTGAVPVAATAGAGQGRSGRDQKRALGSMMASLRQGRGNPASEGAAEAAPSFLNQVGTAADDAAGKKAAESKYGKVAGALAGVKAGAGQVRAGVGKSIGENLADRRVLAGQRRDKWNRMSNLEKAAHRVGQTGSLAKTVGSTAWKHKGKLAMAAGAGAVVTLSAGTAAPALALGAMAASGYGSVKGVGLASTHGVRSKARHALAGQAIHGMGEGSALAQRVRRGEERRMLSAQSAEQRGYSSQLAGGIDGSSLSQKVLSRIGSTRDMSSRNADAIVSGRLAEEARRQEDKLETRRSAQQAEAAGENPGELAREQAPVQQDRHVESGNRESEAVFADAPGSSQRVSAAPFSEPAELGGGDADRDRSSRGVDQFSEQMTPAADRSGLTTDRAPSTENPFMQSELTDLDGPEPGSGSATAPELSTAPEAAPAVSPSTGPAPESIPEPSASPAPAPVPEPSAVAEPAPVTDPAPLRAGAPTESDSRANSSSAGRRADRSGAPRPKQGPAVADGPAELGGGSRSGRDGGTQ